VHGMRPTPCAVGIHCRQRLLCTPLSHAAKSVGFVTGGTGTAVTKRLSLHRPSATATPSNQPSNGTQASGSNTHEAGATSSTPGVGTTSSSPPPAAPPPTAPSVFSLKPIYVVLFAIIFLGGLLFAAISLQLTSDGLGFQDALTLVSRD